MAHEIRLACFYCDTDECDGIDEVPPDWTEVEEFQSYAESLEEVAPDDPARTPLDWYTHLGVCPDCRKVYG